MLANFDCLISNVNVKCSVGPIFWTLFSVQCLLCSRLSFLASESGRASHRKAELLIEKLGLSQSGRASNREAGPLTEREGLSQKRRASHRERQGLSQRVRASHREAGPHTERQGLS